MYGLRQLKKGDHPHHDKTRGHDHHEGAPQTADRLPSPPTRTGHVTRSKQFRHYTNTAGATRGFEPLEPPEQNDGNRGWPGRGGAGWAAWRDADGGDAMARKRQEQSGAAAAQVRLSTLHADHETTLPSPLPVRRSGLHQAALLSGQSWGC